MRLLENKVEMKNEECARAHKVSEALRAELQEERSQMAQIKEKYDVLRSHQAQTDEVTTT